MEKRIKVSVVIPVYQAERYLRQCLDSILAQDVREIEIICVDDCSRDRSVDILTAYSGMDSRIRILRNRENVHAGCCRNRGLEAAQGEYLLFMDADDWLFPNSLRRIYIEAKRYKADVLRCRALDVDNRTGKTSCSVHNGLKKIPVFLFDRAVKYTTFYWIFPKICVAPWGGIVRRQFLLENGILFNDLLCVNDRSFFWETILKAEKIIFSPEFLVHYRINLSDSLIANRIKNFSCHFSSYRMIENLSSDLPRRMRRSILDGELLDMIHWLEQSRDTNYADAVREMTWGFIHEIDQTTWQGKVEKQKWYRRLCDLR